MVQVSIRTNKIGTIFRSLIRCQIVKSLKYTRYYSGIFSQRNTGIVQKKYVGTFPLVDLKGFVVSIYNKDKKYFINE